MRRISLLFLTLALAAAPALMAQEVLMTIGDESVTLEDYERIYNKNNNENSLNRQNPEEYLELFVNFRLKVMEAEALGMDTTAKFNNELAGYRKQLAKPYLSDDEAREQMLHEAYEWSKYDVRASHILIRVPEGASVEDTLIAYNKIMEIRDRIIGGEDFAVVARATSDDASASRNGGDLNYFTVFSMVYPFEKMAYTTPVGKLSMPFRSSFGYHILMVVDKRPARGTIKVSHIFARISAAAESEDAQKAEDKIMMVYDSLQAGVDFAKLASEYSEDYGTAQDGGSLPWFGSGRMIPIFEDACFTLENKGDYSEPFRSDFGWHIVMLEDKRPIGSYEEMLPDMQNKINQGGRSAARTDNYINKLKAEYAYEEHKGNLSPIYEEADTTLLQGTWKAGDLADDQSLLIKLGNKTVTTGEFASYVQEKQIRGKARDYTRYIDFLYGEFSKEVVIGYEESKLEDKYPEFRYVYEEYHDGILLFDIMDQKVWTKAVEDSTGLEAFHKAHRKDYMWDERVDAWEVNCSEDVDIEAVKKNYKKIAKGKLTAEKLNKQYCENDTIPCINVVHHLVLKGENESLDALIGTEGPGQISEEDGRRSFFIFKSLHPAEPKKLDEARGQIISDYQTYLEEEWIKELKAKYPVEINTELLKTIK